MKSRTKIKTYSGLQRISNFYDFMTTFQINFDQLWVSSKQTNIPKQENTQKKSQIKHSLATSNTERDICWI